MMLFTIVALTGCVEDVAKDKVEAIVEDVEAGHEMPAEEAPAAPAGDVWAVDASKSSVKALGAKVTATHPIDFGEFEGKLTVADNAVTSVEYTVQVASLVADHPKLTAHLMTEDFFNVQANPTATFKSTEITAGSDTEGMSHTVKGEMMIMGQTKVVTFPANITVTDEGATASTEFALDRQDFGIAYPGKPDDLIQDKVVMTVALAAMKPSM